MRVPDSRPVSEDRVSDPRPNIGHAIRVGPSPPISDIRSDPSKAASGRRGGRRGGVEGGRGTRRGKE